MSLTKSILYSCMINRDWQVLSLPLHGGCDEGVTWRGEG